MIVTDDSVDIDDVEKIPLYVEWRGRKIEVSKLKRSSYFFSTKKTIVDLPSFQEVKDELMGFLAKGEEINVVLPSWPINLVKRTVTLVSSMAEGIHVYSEKMDSIMLMHALKNKKNLESINSISEMSKTYLLFSDMSFLRKNGIVPEESTKMIVTKSANLIKYAHGKVFVKGSWSVKGILSTMMREINEKRFTVYIRHSGKSRMANGIASSFLSSFKCKVSIGWMNPVVASQYGHGTVSVTVIPEV